MNKAHAHLIPEEASKRSSLLTSQSRLSQNNAQLERFPRIREAVQRTNRQWNNVTLFSAHSNSYVLCVFRVYSDYSTQQLIEEVDNLLPGLRSFLPSKFRKVGSSVVHVQPVDALQHDGDHSLRKQTINSRENVTEGNTWNPIEPHFKNLNNLFKVWVYTYM